MGALRRWLDRLTESDETRLAAETQDWADSIPGSVRLGEAPLRSRVKIAGVIRRITVLPMSGHESLEALVSDGTGEADRGVHGAARHRRLLPRHARSSSRECWASSGAAVRRR